jgi:hypothetical protein
MANLVVRDVVGSVLFREYCDGDGVGGCRLCRWGLGSGLLLLLLRMLDGGRLLRRRVGVLMLLLRCGCLLLFLVISLFGREYRMVWARERGLFWMFWGHLGVVFICILEV